MEAWNKMSESTKRSKSINRSKSIKMSKSIDMTKNMTRSIEIMAPAGSYESLMAAINAGANSVYFGVEQLNMRARAANNFTTRDLTKIVKICRKNNVKAYLALNTVIYNHDI